MTTTGRFFTISGGRKPVLKSQMRTWPGFGWKLISMIEQYTWQHLPTQLATGQAADARKEIYAIAKGKITSDQAYRRDCPAT